MVNFPIYYKYRYKQMTQHFNKNQLSDKIILISRRMLLTKMNRLAFSLHNNMFTSFT